MHKYGVKLPNFTLYDGREHKEKISFSCRELRYSRLLNSTPEKFASISQIEGDGIGANNSKLEPARANSSFLCAVFATIAVVDVKAPHCLT